MLDQIKRTENEALSDDGVVNDASADVPVGVRQWVEEAAAWLLDRVESDGTFTRETALRLLDSIRDRISSAGNGEPPASVPVNSGYDFALIDAFRARLVHTWPQEVGPEAVTVFRALELDGRDVLENQRPEDVTRDFVSTDSGELVVQLAHDLRSPLTSILFLSETLRRGQSGELNQLQARQIGLIYAAALGLSSISGDVIELARGGEGLVEDEPAPFSVGEVFESVRNMVQPLAEEKGLDLRLTHSVSDHWNGHPLALSRVLLNLTTNGLKFTESGYVEIGARATGLASLEFWVRDSGPGIPSHAREDLFKMFRTSANQSRTQFSGTGLGLYICRDLVEKMGSELSYETVPGEGTRFFFELKLNPAGSF